MNDETYEVPIMLSPDIHLTYEDIAKLNPFYEEYRAFWNASSDTTATTLSSMDASSRSSSQHSVRAEIDTLSSPVDVSSSPSLHYPEPYTGLNFPRKLDVPLYEGKQHRPSVRIYDEDLAASQHASFVPDGLVHTLQSINEATEMSDYDSMDVHRIGAPLQRVRSSHKKLFGTNGWLGNTSELRDVPLRRQKSGIFRDLGKKIKHHVGEIAEDMAKAYPKPFAVGSRRSRIVPEPTIPISLDPPAQARLYSEMEVMICQTANRFLIQQYAEGRVSGESIRKVTSFWGSKNRPQVVEFQFDQATQRRLILSNVRALQFNGECSTNPILLHSNLHNWKAVVKEMSIRTFCAPDSAIRKHMHDIHKLLDMLNAQDSTFISFERLQMQVLALMSERRQTSYQLERSNSTFSRSSGRPTENSWIVH
ncbi:uncharacterized protein ACLA_074470 [Aspergillus clavatus NRRL 1]|uniref:Uncharacterized protein n=1 Tax=Aspergillus clavatus (strain ATCC 1007 / CBS 513.65 / DSM 816 / NCTC 3887 / NRRL 1 / QM 1276 / 107) TaxID=344612 RepID=A1C7N9_ASPCL|nr:uncharacterized protein ACLA_074470 [Aspergillus clavatus NRRL 1]EAW14410.1 conserved hypothetical protein [Aspergillus clavatus NRRL 1]